MNLEPKTSHLRFGLSARTDQFQSHCRVPLMRRGELSSGVCFGSDVQLILFDHTGPMSSVQSVQRGKPGQRKQGSSALASRQRPKGGIAPCPPDSWTEGRPARSACHGRWVYRKIGKPRKWMVSLWSPSKPTKGVPQQKTHHARPKLRVQQVSSCVCLPHLVVCLSW